MKVICIDNKIIREGVNFPKNWKWDLSIGKIYTAKYIITDSYYLMDDNNIENLYDKTLFITLQEYRNNLIKEILEND